MRAIGHICDLEKNEIKCKIILNSKTKIPNNVIFIELIRLPISIICKQRILMYWFKIIHNKDSLVYKMYRLLSENANNSTKCKNWACMLNPCYENLVIYIWEFEDVCCASPQNIKQKLMD